MQMKGAKWYMRAQAVHETVFLGLILDKNLQWACTFLDLPVD